MTKYKIGNEVWVIHNDGMDNCIIGRLPLFKRKPTYEVTSLRTLKSFEVNESDIFNTQKEVYEEYMKRNESSQNDMRAFL